VLESIGMETTKATRVQAYYAPLHGKWRCELELVITDELALRNAKVSAFDRLRIRSTVWMRKLLGPLTMSTTLDYETSGDAGVIFHTTRVSKWGITLLSSEESFTVEATGRDFAMRGSQCMIPTYWHAQSFGEGRGSVDESATRATYSFTWMGGPMLQETVATKDTVTMTQTTPFSRGVQRLRRVGT